MNLITVKIKENDKTVVIHADTVEIKGSKYVIKKAGKLIGAFSDNTVEWILVSRAPEIHSNFDPKKLW